MKSTDPLFPYQNFFITARPGMGATKKSEDTSKKYRYLRSIILRI